MSLQSSPRLSISSSFKLLALYLSYGLVVVPISLICLILFITGTIGFRNFREKLGFWKYKRSFKPAPKGSIWVHVSSVGEWRTVVPLLRKLRNERPAVKIVLTYFNEEMTRVTKDETFRSLIDVHAFMSLENPVTTRRWIRCLRVRLLVLVEAEFWPIMLLTTGACNVPIVLVSGSLFEREYRRFRRLRWILRPVWQTIRRFAVITEAVADHFNALGIPRERLRVTGSLKLAGGSALQKLADKQQMELMAFGKWLSEGERFVIFLVSVHFKEFQKLFKALEHLFRSRQYSFIIAPRLVREERKKFLRFFKEHSVPCVVRSEVGEEAIEAKQGKNLSKLDVKEVVKTATTFRHLLVATFGEAVHLMKQSHCVVVGGSFIPVGGHNVLEPLRLGLPTIVGPYHFHIEDMVRSFAEALVVCGVEELEQALVKIAERHGYNSHNDSAKQIKYAREYARRLEQQFQALGGATERTFRELQAFLQ